MSFLHWIALFLVIYILTQHLILQGDSDELTAFVQVLFLWTAFTRPFFTACLYLPRTHNALTYEKFRSRRRVARVQTIKIAMIVDEKQICNVKHNFHVNVLLVGNERLQHLMKQKKSLLLFLHFATSDSRLFQSTQNHQIPRIYLQMCKIPSSHQDVDWKSPRIAPHQIPSFLVDPNVSCFHASISVNISDTLLIQPHRVWWRLMSTFPTFVLSATLIAHFHLVFVNFHQCGMGMMSVTFPRSTFTRPVGETLTGGFDISVTIAQERTGSTYSHPKFQSAINIRSLQRICVVKQTAANQHGFWIVLHLHPNECKCFWSCRTTYDERCQSITWIIVHSWFGNWDCFCKKRKESQRTPFRIHQTVIHDLWLLQNHDPWSRATAKSQTETHKIVHFVTAWKHNRRFDHIWQNVHKITSLLYAWKFH